MTKQEFLKKMKEEILDTEYEIEMDTLLSDIEEWDSLAYISFIAMARVMNCNGVTRKTVRETKRVEDLYELLQ